MNSKYNSLRRAFAIFTLHGMLLIWICPILRLWGVMKPYNKRALKPFNATTLKNALSTLK
ncbi:hypothetical protein ACQKAI_03445 [Helicobacter pylori]